MGSKGSDIRLRLPSFGSSDGGGALAHVFARELGHVAEAGNGLTLADMVCRHTKGDPSCSSSPNYVDYSSSSSYSTSSSSYSNEPKPEEAIPVDVVRVGPHLVMKVRYPSCRSCAYEGVKVLVYLNVSEIEAIRWRFLDPHFKDPKKPVKQGYAPAPAARFPASLEGWQDAQDYAAMKVAKGVKR